MTREETAMKINELMNLLTGKDDLISRLQLKIENLIEQGKKRNSSASLDRNASADKTISLNVKVNTANQNMRKENQKLKVTVRELSERIDEMEMQNDSLAKEKETLQREITMLKKTIEKYEKITDNMRMSKVSGGPKFLKNSYDPTYLAEINQAKQSVYSIPKITVVQPGGKEPAMQESLDGSQPDLKKEGNGRESKVINRSVAPPRPSIDMNVLNASRLDQPPPRLPVV